MTSCERAHSLYGPAWDDELSVSERESLERHFDACPACRRDYDEFARTLELVQSLPRPAVTADFAARVVAEAHRREAQRPAARVFAWPWGNAADRAAGFGRPRAGALAWAAALFVVAGTGALVLSRPELLPGGAGGQHAARPALVAQGDADTPAERTTVLPPSVTEFRTPAAPAVRETGSSSGEPSRQLATRGSGPARTTTASRVAPPATEEMAAVPDSLFDHTADVEFVLDPVKLRRERGRGYTPVPTGVKGENASITF